MDLLFTEERRRKALEGDLDASQASERKLKENCAEMSAANEGLRAQVGAKQDLLDEESRQLRGARATITELRALIAKHEQTMENMHLEMMAHETERRKLHNTIQELKVTSSLLL